MPTYSAWYINDSGTHEVLEMTAKDSCSAITVARSNLIQLAATLMEQTSNHTKRLETPANIEITSCGSTSLKLTVSYPRQDQSSMVSRMMERRRLLQQASAE
jgi:hypothetical protein